MEILEELKCRIKNLIAQYDRIEKECKYDSFKQMDCISKKMALLQFLSEIHDIEYLEMKKYNQKRSMKELEL